MDKRDEHRKFLKDFKPGPLDEYRSQASFDWKEMAVTIENSETLKFKVRYDTICSLNTGNIPNSIKQSNYASINICF